MLTTRNELKDYCLRRLGHPVIEINVDEDQVEDRIQDAIEFWQEYHFDGIERIFLKAQVAASTLTLSTADANLFTDGETITGATSGATADIYAIESTTQFALSSTLGTFENGETITGSISGAAAITAAADAFVLGNWDAEYFEVSDAVTGVSRIFTLGPGTSGTNPRNMFDVIYQFRLQDMYNLLSTDMIYYAQVKQHLSMLDMLLPGERTIRFNRKSSRIHVDVNWKEVFHPGDYIVAECFRIMDPEEFGKVYNDLFLKRYATALIKRQWGENMKKFSGIQLPGGVTLNGIELYNEATREIETIEQEMQSRYEEPPIFMIG